MTQDTTDIGHVGQPASRQLYLTPVGERAAWAIYEMTLDADQRVPTFTKLSSGHPSLAKLIPDALAIFEDEIDNRVPLTITQTPVGDDPGSWLLDTCGAIYAKPDTAIELALPTRSDGDLWAWGGKNQSAPFRYHLEGRFRITTIRSQIATLFNEPHRPSDIIDPSAPKLAEYARGETRYDLWLRPTGLRAKSSLSSFPRQL